MNKDELRKLLSQSKAIDKKVAELKKIDKAKKKLEEYRKLRARVNPNFHDKVISFMDKRAKAQKAQQHNKPRVKARSFNNDNFMGGFDVFGSTPEHKTRRKKQGRNDNPMDLLGF